MIEQHIAHGFSVLRYHSWGQNLFLPPALFLRDCKELVKIKDEMIEKSTADGRTTK